MRFSSRDVSRVETTWKDYVPSASLQRVDPQRFRFDWYSEMLSGSSLVRYTLAAAVHSSVAPENQLLVCRVYGADARLASRREHLDPSRPWITDGFKVHANWDTTAEIRAFIFDQATVQSYARQLSGDDGMRVRLEGLHPHNPAAGQRWERTFTYLERSVADAGETDALLRAELGRHALAVTLASFPTSLDSAIQRPAQTVPAPAAVRRALAYISEHAHEAITVDDVAAAVHMSTRGLQYAFRRSLDATPAEYVRRARLDGAHQDLRSESNDSIAVIARRWGFAHPSRFAAAYRSAYGVSPSETRRRHS